MPRPGLKRLSMSCCVTEAFDHATTLGPATALARDLIRLESVTPDKGDTLDLLQSRLEALGFVCHRMTFEEAGTDPVPNLYARLGTDAPNLCFAGHTDVVPAGATDDWTVAPFSGAVKNGQLWGRGAADMKGAIAAFVVAVEQFLNTHERKGSLSLLITGDEEGPSINGTRKVLDWLKDRGETLDYCVVGEPTNPHEMGDMIKIGRRGSLHGVLKVVGTQGHVAYPHRAHNPIPDLVALCAALVADPLDAGNDHFQPSNLEIINLHVGNITQNIIPAEAEARFNVRFSSEYTPESLKQELTGRLDSVGPDYDIDWWVSGDSFLTPPGLLSDTVQKAVERQTGRKPELSTTGGTSDARFIKDFCPVVEFGLIGETMHKVDEHVATADIDTLTAIYVDIIRDLVG